MLMERKCAKENKKNKIQQGGATAIRGGVQKIKMRNRQKARVGPGGIGFGPVRFL